MKKKLIIGVLALCSMILFAIGNSNQAVIYAGANGNGNGNGNGGGAIPDVTFNGMFNDSTVAPTTGSRAGIVYQAPDSPPPPLDADTFKAIAIEQGHYHSGAFAPGADYPNGSYYYDAPTNTIPNIIYVDGDLNFNGNMITYGVYYVNGSVSMNGNTQLEGIVICNGDFTANGGGNKTPNLHGGVVQYGSTTTLRGNGNPVEIHISDQYFTTLRGVLPVVDVVSWQEAVSAN